MTKILYIIAGPNGSGKTTLAKELVNDEKLLFLNADEIAKRKKDELGISSGKSLLKQLRVALSSDKSIVLESTISGHYHKDIIFQAKRAKYNVVLVFVFLMSVEQNLARIKQRVKIGGHNVPEIDVIRRYGRSLTNFWDVIQTVDQWELYYNGENSYEIVARGKNEIVEIMDDALYNSFKKEAK